MRSFTCSLDVKVILVTSKNRNCVTESHFIVVVYCMCYSGSD